MELLDSRQLRAFQELARMESFTEAAQQLNLTQSAVSHSIKALERSIDAILFERRGKRVSLTTVGKTFLPRVNQILAMMKTAQEEIKKIQRPGYGRLRIGATVSISQYVLPTILQELRGSFPNFEITVRTDDSLQLTSQVQRGDIDIAIALAPGSSDKIEFTPLFEDQIELALSPAHPLAQARELRREDIASEDLIVYGQASETLQLIEEIFSDMRGSVQAAMQVGSMAAIKEMAKIGMGVGLLAPWVAMEEIAARTLIFLSIPGKVPIRNWGILSSRKHQPESIEAVFSSICAGVIANMQLLTAKYRAEMTAGTMQDRPAPLTNRG